MKRITAKLRRKILELDRRGNSVTTIARHLGVATAQVEREIWKAEHPDERPPQRAPTYQFRHFPKSHEPMPVHWKCHCGARAFGEQCFNGHSAPWAAETQGLPSDPGTR